MLHQQIAGVAQDIDARMIEHIFDVLVLRRRLPNQPAIALLRRHVNVLPVSLAAEFTNGVGRPLRAPGRSHLIASLDQPQQVPSPDECYRTCKKWFLAHFLHQ